MRALAYSIAFAAVAMPGSAQGGESLTFVISSAEQRTVFMADEGAAAAGGLPVMFICHDSAASNPSPEVVTVRIGKRQQSLSRGQCSFFSGEVIEVEAGQPQGVARVKATLLR